MAAGAAVEMTAPPTTAVAQVDGLTKRFGERTVLDGVELAIEPGEIVALIGRSGSGKSTLLRVLADLERADQGRVSVTGGVAIAFQDARLLPWKRVHENVVLGVRTEQPGAMAERVLDEVGLSDHRDAWPFTLSGGEAQRASLARALVRDPELLLLDEPFGALDALTTIAMHDLVLELWRRHRPAILLVTHDVDEALALADRIVVLVDGRISHQETVELDRPRERDHPNLIEQRRRLLAELGVDTKGIAQ
jgi:sulfonate transport system ATP-binding protein